ncbi:MAG: hypothetical protein NTZ61_08695 [Proteobacteria bacterium]|nr:hypothetical protein [Pseudomonadota bacterium]
MQRVAERDYTIDAQTGRGRLYRHLRAETDAADEQMRGRRRRIAGQHRHRLTERAFEDRHRVRTRFPGLGEREVEAQRQILPLRETTLQSLDERVLHVATRRVREHHADARTGGPPLGHTEHTRYGGDAADRLVERDLDFLESG